MRQPRGKGIRRSIFMERVGTVSHQGPRSSKVTRAPASARRAAVTEPPNPLPMTITSFVRPATFAPTQAPALYQLKVARVWVPDLRWTGQCPLWVMTGHDAAQSRCPLDQFLNAFHVKWHLLTLNKSRPGAEACE